MYKKLTTWSAILLLFAAGSAAAELKIAVLDTQRALIESEEAQALLAQAQQELQAEQDQLQSLNDEIVALTEQLQKDGEVMSPAEQRRMQKEIEDKQIDLQFLGNKLQKEVNDRRQELEGYDMIMERGSLRYVNSKHDITRRVTEKLNEKQ